MEQIDLQSKIKEISESLDDLSRELEPEKEIQLEDIMLVLKDMQNRQNKVVVPQLTDELEEQTLLIFMLVSTIMMVFFYMFFVTMDGMLKKYSRKHVKIATVRAATPQVS